MKHEIKNRYTSEVLFTFEYDEENASDMVVRDALEKAISVGADLRYADLSNTSLHGADLNNADLRYADLSNANLRGADLSNTSLRGANLSDTDLWGADLCDTDLYDTDLSNADLRYTYLEGAKNAPLLINGLLWHVIIDGVGKMHIGCQIHTIEGWKNFTDEQIIEMDNKALEFWNKHKVMLLSLCDSYKHN